MRTPIIQWRNVTLTQGNCIWVVALKMITQLLSCDSSIKGPSLEGLLYHLWRKRVMIILFPRYNLNIFGKHWVPGREPKAIVQWIVFDNLFSFGHVLVVSVLLVDLNLLLSRVHSLNTNLYPLNWADDVVTSLYVLGYFKPILSSHTTKKNSGERVSSGKIRH